MSAKASASMSATSALASSSRQSSADAQSTAALYKLALFTVAMVIGPIATYFLSLEHLWGKGNTTHAAISAALVANLVVFAYIVTALREDAAEQKGKKKE